MCVCSDGYELSDDDPRVCVEKKCDKLSLADNQELEDNEHNEGPYPKDAVVKVNCTGGSHVKGAEKDVIEQTLKCLDTGIFDPVLQDCVGELGSINERIFSLYCLSVCLLS